MVTGTSFSALIRTFVLGLAAASAMHAAAADWPARPLQLVVPASAGSGTDVMARAMAQRLAIALGQPVVVDNKPGASGTIGIGQVVRAAPDGYTLLYTNASVNVIAPALLRSTSFDPVHDLTPVAQTAVGGVLLLANRDVPASNLRELIALVKSDPDRYATYGSWANGSSGHLMMEWLKKQTGMRITHVPYRSVPQLLGDLSAGVIRVAWADPSSPVPFLKSGRIKGIALSGNVRIPATPDIATMGEQGYPFDTVGWFGIFSPAGTPVAIVQRLSDEVNRVQRSPEMAALMSGANFEPPPVKTQAQFREIVERDYRTWKKIVADAGITAD